MCLKTYDSYVADTNDSIAQVISEQGELSADVEALTNTRESLQQAKSQVTCLTSSPTITLVNRMGECIRRREQHCDISLEV